MPEVPVAPDVTLYVEDVPGPDDRTLLVVHGGPDWDCSYLREPLVELAGRNRVLLVDLRGCGRSTRGLPEDRYTWDAAAGDLVTLLDRLGLPAVDVLGFSAGGRVAQRLTLAAPERVRRLVVASSSVEPVPPDPFAGWAERQRRATAAGQPDPSLSGPAMTEAWARASATMNVWRAEALPEYLRRPRPSPADQARPARSAAANPTGGAECG